MPKGEVVTPTEKRYIDAIGDSVDPTKQLERVETRSTWVFTSVGVVGSALAGFTLLAGGDNAVVTAHPVLAIAVLALTLVALTLAASTLVLHVDTVNPNDVEEARVFF